MKILVTGGLGFIGHNVVRFLEQLGHEVVITDIRSDYGIIPADELQYLVNERKKKFKTDRIHAIDISDKDGIEWLFRTYQFDVVVHLAAFPRQKVVNNNPQLGSRAMSEGLLNLLETSGKHKIDKFVYVSSSMVYGDFNDDNINEDHPTNPIGQYGIMKLAGEWLVKDYTKRNCFNHVIIRPSAVYGELDVEDRVVSKFLLNAIRNEAIQVNGATECLDFTYVDDVAKGIAITAINPITNNQTYNLTRGNAHTLLNAAELAIKIAGQGEIKVNPKDSNFPSRGQLNNTKAKYDFGFNPTTDIEQGFQLYYDWLINNPIYRPKKTV